MSLSPIMLDALAALGYTSEEDLSRWRMMWEDEGDELVWQFIGYERKAAADLRIWLPRLRTYEEQCRRVSPVADVCRFTPVEREQYRILLGAMRKTKCKHSFESGPNDVWILHTSRIGLPAAHKVFAESGAIILESSELQRWSAEHKEQLKLADSSWDAYAHWKLFESVPEYDLDYVNQYHPPPDGCQHWVLEYAVILSCLNCHGHRELWRWNGERAEFVSDYSCFCS